MGARNVFNRNTDSSSGCLRNYARVFLLSFVSFAQFCQTAGSEHFSSKWSKSDFSGVVQLSPVG